jgi:hypothetical protein
MDGILEEIKEFVEANSLNIFLETDGGNFKLKEPYNMFLLKANKRSFIYKFINYNKKTNEIKNRYSILEEIEVNKIELLKDFVELSRSKLKYYDLIEKILGLKSFGVKKIKVSGNSKMKVDSGVLFIREQDLKFILNESSKIFKEANGYGSSLINYLCNNLARDMKIRVVTKTTSIKPGEFGIMIDRLHLPTKKRREDYLEYLNKKDILYLQDLTEDMLKKEAFDSEFMKKIDDYFIRQKLEEIIEIGYGILDLGVEDLTTDKAINVKRKIKNGEKVRA